MYWVVNLDTRAVLTYRDGTRIVKANEVLAQCTAVAAQEYHHHPHAVVPITGTGVDALGREVAPWFRK